MLQVYLSKRYLHCSNSRPVRQWVPLSKEKLAWKKQKVSKLFVLQYGPTLLLSHQLMNITLLDSLHYDSQASQYRDWGNHTEDVELRNWYPGLPIVPKGQRLPDDILKHARSNGLVRFVDKAPEPMFVPHFGSASLVLTSCFGHSCFDSLCYGTICASSFPICLVTSTKHCRSMYVHGLELPCWENS